MMAYSFSAETRRLVSLLCEQNTVLTVHSLHFAHTVDFYSLCDSENASKTWTVTKANERRLGLFERNVRRCIFGAKQEKEIWRKKDIIMNYTKYLMIQTLSVTSKLKDWHGQGT